MPSARSILVVDDEAVIRELLTDIIADQGYRVESCSNGFEALKVLKERDEFVLLFTDILMPEMDGIQLVREARKVRPAIIPIIMTGFGTLETARAAVKEGAYDYVLKPFSLSEIKLAVTNAFERHRLENENARLMELTELFRISESIASMRDEGRLLDFVLRAALERVNAERGSLMLTTPDGQALEIAASVGVPHEVTQEIVEVGQGISGWVAQHVAPLLVEDIKDNPEVAQVSHHFADRSFISVPLERKTNLEALPDSTANGGPAVLAVLNVSQKREGGCFSDGDLAVLNIVANHAAAAIQNVRFFRDLEQAHVSTIRSMALLLEAKDTYTHGHSARVSDCAVYLAEKLGLPQEEISTIRLAAPFHDIGKVGVCDAVLNKADPLTDEEWELIRQHPVIGHDILKPVQFLTADHLQIVRCHHERIDGKGYPDALSGDAVPLVIRVIGVADAFDAMASDRAYRPALPIDQIVSELERGRGAQFDAEVTDLLLASLKSGELQLPSETPSTVG